MAEEAKKPEKEQKEQKSEKQEQLAKRWKGKDWFVIYAPKMFNNVVIAETPALDSSSLVGRSVDVNVSQLTGQASKYYMGIKFKIDSVEGKDAQTSFDGYRCTRDYLFHVVRKRTEKVRHIRTVETKDKWKLEVIALLILNRRTDENIQTKIRKMIDEQLDSAAKKSSVDAFMRDVIAGSLQKEMKRLGNKTYPVRFSEIESVKVLASPKAEK